MGEEDMSPLVQTCASMRHRDTVRFSPGGFADAVTIPAYTKGTPGCDELITWNAPPAVRITVYEGDGYGLKVVDEVDFEGEVPVWLNSVVERLQQLLHLPPNWDSYGARPIAASPVARSLRLLSEVMGEATPVPSIVPVPDGGIGVEWHVNGLDAEIEVDPDQKVSLFWTKAGDADGHELEGPDAEDALPVLLRKLTT